MNPDNSMTRVIGGLRYSVGNSRCIADDLYWDGSNWERSGRNTFLYKTKGGRYFMVNLTCWQDERDTLEPVSLEEAIQMYESLPEQNVAFETAFPEVLVEEA